MENDIAVSTSICCGTRKPNFDKIVIEKILWPVFYFTNTAVTTYSTITLYVRDKIKIHTMKPRRMGAKPDVKAEVEP